MESLQKSSLHNSQIVIKLEMGKPYRHGFLFVSLSLTELVI